MTEPTSGRGLSRTENRAGSVRVPVMDAYLYDWNQDGSGVQGRASCTRPEQPSVGDEVVLYGDGLAVVARVISIDEDGLGFATDHGVGVRERP